MNEFVYHRTAKIWDTAHTSENFHAFVMVDGVTRAMCRSTIRSAGEGRVSHDWVLDNGRKMCSSCQKRWFMMQEPEPVVEILPGLPEPENTGNRLVGRTPTRVTKLDNGTVVEARTLLFANGAICEVRRVTFRDGTINVTATRYRSNSLVPGGEHLFESVAPEPEPEPEPTTTFLGYVTYEYQNVNHTTKGKAVTVPTSGLALATADRAQKEIHDWFCRTYGSGCKIREVRVKPVQEIWS